jgi:hypothetical protein
VNALRGLAFVAGLTIALATTANIVRTLVVPRARRLAFSYGADYVVDRLFQWLVRPVRTYERRDRVLAAQGAGVLLFQLGLWLGAYELGYSLMQWLPSGHLPRSFEEVASSMFTLGIVASQGAGPIAVDVVAGATGMVVIALQIAYLPTLYGAFNRRETEVTLLGARAGTPAWGPELLVRTRYGVAVQRDDLPALYLVWERWAADVAESHANYPVLVRFRSPRALSSWLVSLLAIMDSAAMLLALRPSQDRIEPRRALRMGFTALGEIGAALGMAVDTDPNPDADISLSFEEFAAAVDQLAGVGFPMERTAAEAWPHFKGWRVNYERLAYALACRVDAVPAPWSGPRRWAATVEPVRRPANRAPKGSAPPKGFAAAARGADGDALTELTPEPGHSV